MLEHFITGFIGFIGFILFTSTLYFSGEDIKLSYLILAPILAFAGGGFSLAIGIVSVLISICIAIIKNADKVIIKGRKTKNK